VHRGKISLHHSKARYSYPAIRAELSRNEAAAKLRVKALRRFAATIEHSFLSRATKLTQ
jgi:hypothetical protein